MGNQVRQMKEKTMENTWEAGQIVKVGFVSGLEVVRRTPWGSYCLRKGISYYEFMPHQGLRKLRGSDQIAHAVGNIQAFASDELNAVCDNLAASLEEITSIAGDEEFGDLEERLEEAFSREDVIREAAEALAKYKLMKRTA